MNRPVSPVRYYCAKYEGTRVPQSDADLVRASLDGEREAFGELYDRYAPLIRAIAFNTAGELAEAQDVAQDVFLRAYEKLAELRDADRFAPWLVGIARRVASESLRRRGRDRSHFIRSDCEAVEASADATTGGETGELHRALAELPEEERLALAAFYLQGHSADEAARTLHRSRSGFYKLLARARRRLGRLLDRQQEQMR